MSEFAAAFRQHVIPRLQADVRRLAWEGWDGSFSDAIWELHAIARTHGSLHLSEEHWDALDDWLSKTLLDEIEISEQERQEADEFVASMMRATDDPSVFRRAVRAWIVKSHQDWLRGQNG